MNYISVSRKQDTYSEYTQELFLFILRGMSLQMHLKH